MATHAEANSPADHVDGAMRQIEDDRQDHQGAQGRHAVTRQNPVIHLQQEEGSGEHQNVAQAAEESECPKDPAARMQECSDFGSQYPSSGVDFCRKTYGSMKSMVFLRSSNRRPVAVM